MYIRFKCRYYRWIRNVIIFEYVPFNIYLSKYWIYVSARAYIVTEGWKNYRAVWGGWNESLRCVNRNWCSRICCSILWKIWWSYTELGIRSYSYSTTYDSVISWKDWILDFQVTFTCNVDCTSYLLSAIKLESRLIYIQFNFISGINCSPLRSLVLIEIWR